jgi:hypothetical protein
MSFSRKQGTVKATNKSLPINVFAVVLFASAISQGATLTPLEALLATQGTVPDIDGGLLSQFVFQQTTDTLNYRMTSTADLSAWSATMTGQYAGTPVTVSYSGNLLEAPGGFATSWTSTGFYGAAPWMGGGEALITVTANGFEVHLTDALQVDQNTGSTAVVIDAACPGATCSVTAMAGALMVNDADACAGPAQYVVDFSIPTFLFGNATITNHWECRNAQGRLITTANSLFGLGVSGEPGGGVEIPFGRVDMSATVVPEPSTYLTFGISLLGILSYLWWKRNLQS